jgi:hypothetical protein
MGGGTFFQCRRSVIIVAAYQAARGKDAVPVANGGHGDDRTFGKPLFQIGGSRIKPQRRYQA